MTLLKRNTPVTKTINGQKFFAKDFAYVGDPVDPSTWKYRLTNKPNGIPTPARVSAVIKQFSEQRYAIPPDALDSILDKIREAWMKAFPSKSPEDMPPELSDETPPDDKQEETSEEDETSDGETSEESNVPPGDGEDESTNEEGAEDTYEESSGKEDSDEEDDENKKKPVGKQNSEEDDESNKQDDEEDDAEKEEEEEDEDEADMVDKILKGYIDTSAGAKTFAEVFEICRQQDEHYEMLDKAWPVISALDQSIRSIVADTEIDTTTKHTMLRNSVETFLAAIKSVMPEIEEVLEKALNTIGFNPEKGNRMSKNTDVAALQKQLNELSKKLTVLESEKSYFKAVADLSPEEKEYFDKANDKAKAEFLKMKPAERAQAIAKAKKEDEVIEVDGNKLYKSKCDPAMWAFIKAQAEQTENLKKKLDEEREARREAQLAKRAKDELSYLAGTDEEKVELLKALETLPESQRKVMDSVLKSASAAAQLSMQALGVRHAPSDLTKARNDEAHPFTKAVNEIRARDNCSHQEAMRKARKENPEAFQDWQTLNGANGRAH